MRMRIRPLILHDALRLASVLSKYVDISKLKPEQDALEFVDSIVQQISAQDFLACLYIMTKKTEQDLEKMTGYETLALFTSGLRVNRVLSLLEFFNSLEK